VDVWPAAKQTDRTRQKIANSAGDAVPSFLLELSAIGWARLYSLYMQAVVNRLVTSNNASSGQV
jgi:hypothetical protein